MQTAYEAEQQRRETLTETQRQALENEIAGKALLPLVGRLVRILISGGADASDVGRNVEIPGSRATLSRVRECHASLACPAEWSCVGCPWDREV